MKTRLPTLMENDRLLSWAIAALAICLFVSPWALGYRGHLALQWNAWLVGFLLAYTAFAELFELLVWEEWAVSAMGVWLALSPWILRFGGETGVASVQSLIGVSVAVISGLELWHARHPPGHPSR